MTPIKKFPVVSLIALSMAIPAFAQEAPAPQPAPQTAPPADDRASDVVVVTANKRQESVQDVAVAVTAVTSEMREELGIATVTDLTNLTPGLSYTAANERITLRGIGRNTNNFGADPGVANYTDGVYQAFATIAGRDNIFTDRIEVLRGPQGTLYGRNSIGGALNIVSKRPTDDFQGEFRMGAGDYDQLKIASSISGPITDWLRYRVVGYDEARADGVHRNLGTGTTEGYEVNNWNLEGQLEADFGENLTAWFKYTTGRYTMAGPPGGRTSTFSEAPYLKPFGSQATFTYNNAFVDGGVVPQGTYAFSGDSSVIGYTQDGGTTENPFSQGIKAFNSSRESTADLDAYNDYAAEINYSTPWGFDVKYVGGYIYYDYHLYGDNDDNPVRSITYNSIQSMTTAGPCAALIPASGVFITPTNFPRSTIPTVLQGCITSSAPITIYPNWTSHYNETRSFFSNEVNFISTGDGPLQWIGGLYAYQENSQQPVETFIAEDPGAGTRGIVGTALTLPNPNNRLTYTNNSGLFNAYGIYGQVDYALTDEFKLTGGLRYSYDLKEITETAELNCYIICSAVTGRTNRIVDITPVQWNGVRQIPNPANPAQLINDPRPQPGVVSATLANPTGVTYNAVTGLATRELKDDWDAITGTAGVEYTPTRDTLVFAKYSRGYKSGGFNASSMAPIPRTKKELVDATWPRSSMTTRTRRFR
jgi:iron complex outermembrane recepter protein